MGMNRTGLVLGMAVFSLALSGAVHAAGEPAMPGQAVGRSVLPAPVDHQLQQETRATGSEIGPLRLQTRDGEKVYSADLQGARSEVVTLDAHGRVLSRRPY